MAYPIELDRRMTVAGAASGITAVFFYFGAAFIPLPDALTRLLAFAFGPLLGLSFIGFFHLLRDRQDGPAVRFAVALGLIASALVTAMLVVQVGNNMIGVEQLAAAESEAAREAALLAHGAVNRVQFLLDVVWDVFICGAGALMGVAMLRHPGFGRIWGGAGILASITLLYLNLDTFPYPPAEMGSVDLGPLLAMWFLAVYARTLVISSRARRPDQA